MCAVGICLNTGTEVSQKHTNGGSPMKVKTLKEIKREKILKARLEYERKKLLAKQHLEGNNLKSY